MSHASHDFHADSPAWTAERRRQIALQNALARAVRIIANLEFPVVRLEIGPNPLDGVR